MEKDIEEFLSEEVSLILVRFLPYKEFFRMLKR
jgi:hypothetical protein